MTAPTFTALGTFLDDTPGASSQATGNFSRTNGRGYLVGVLLQNSITANPAAPTAVTATGFTGTFIGSEVVRASGTNRAILAVFFGVASSTTNSAITVSYASGDSITSVTVLVDEVTDFETSTDAWMASNVQSGHGSIPAATNTSFYTMNALDHADNRVVSYGYVNGGPSTATGFDFETNLTNLSTQGSNSAPTHTIISGYRNSATPDTTPAIRADGGWTAGMISVEIRGAGTAATPVTGTAAVTLGSDTSAASGTETFTGTAAPTLANDTSVATGTETFAGTVAVTLADDTAAASGAETIEGTSTPTAGDDTSSADGEVINPVSGTADITLADDTSSATGTETITGTAALAVSDDTSSASGTITITGTVSVVLADDTSTVIALVVITGTVAVTLSGDTISAIGATGLVIVTFVIAARWREPAPVQGVEFPVVAFTEPRIEPWAEPALPRYREPRP